jgi:hypothetical protein
MMNRINGGNDKFASKTILRVWNHFVIIATIQYVLMVAIVALIGFGCYKGINYIDKHGLKNIVERIWNGERK